MGQRRYRPEIGFDRQFGRGMHRFFSGRQWFAVFGRVGAVGCRHGHQNEAVNTSTGIPAPTTAAAAATPAETTET
jgi:hypothetical protein